MKTLDQLTETEQLKLFLAQAQLRESALHFSLARDKHEAMTMLYVAARKFDSACADAGLSDWWREVFVETPTCCP